MNELSDHSLEPFEGARVLAIDDDQPFLHLVRETLAHMGFTVEAKPGGKAGLRAFDNMQPHLVVLDLMMPEVSGLDVLREIREQSDVPVLFLSSCDSEADVSHALESGADDYLVKPFRLLEFQARVHALLRRAWTVEPMQ